MRSIAPLAIALALVLIAGCGSGGETTGSESAAPPGAAASTCATGGSGVEDLRATAVGCAEARLVAAGWRRAKECDKYGGDSRTACSLLSYRCIATAADRGWSVSCSKPGQSIAFRFRPN
jgi:hypothetical protein